MSKAGCQVRAVYDFAGEPGTAELSIVTGQVLTLTRHDVGEGWWEGVNEAGETGLFPAAYVEEVGGWGPPSMPPPPLPSTLPAEGEGEGGEGEGDYWDDDDWDDEPGRPPANAAPATALPEFPATGAGNGGERKPGVGSGGSGSKKNYRFSGFGKAGVEAFLVSPARLEVSDADRVSIGGGEGAEGGVRWNAPPDHELYSCIVASPKKESKLKGLKSFIAYQITPTFNNIQVSRRYKHFDWLHERLEEKFTLIPIPPLPDKQISGRYEGQFIEHRRVQLQAFVRAVCRHPVLSRSSVWMHFMTCTDDKRWKVGKRREEKDKLLGANYFYALDAPQARLDITAMELESDANSMWMHKMDAAVKLMMATAADQVKKHQGPYKREYQKIGQSFLQLSSVLAEGRSDERLCSAVKATGEAYNEVGILFEEQPKADWEPLGDVLHIYKGLIASFPDILAVHRGALHKRKECEKLALENKMDDRQVDEVKRRSDVVSYAVLAEMNHFRSEQNMDLNEAMKSYLAEQISFYQKVVRTLQNALDTYD